MIDVDDYALNKMTVIQPFKSIKIVSTGALIPSS